LDEGDVLFLYTDGVAQARGPDNTYFQDRLADELTGLAGAAPGQLVAAMRKAVLDFSAGNPVDDVTMLVIRAGKLAKGSAALPGRGGSGRRRPGQSPSAAAI
jgi:serine phosphatase RsbU (regulator of sigma subunit)